MVLGVLSHSHFHSSLVSVSDRAISKVYLSHSRGSNRHHRLTKNISIVVRSNVGSINSSLKESIKHRGVSSVDHFVIVISKSQRAVQIENSVSVSVSEVVSLGQIVVDKPL